MMNTPNRPGTALWAPPTCLPANMHLYAMIQYMIRYHTYHHTFTQLGTIPAFKLFNSTEPDVLRLLFEHRPADGQVSMSAQVWGVLVLLRLEC